MAFLFLFFGGFRCGVPLFIVILVIYLYKIGKIDVKCLTKRWPPVWETAVHLAVAGGVFDGVCCPVSH